MFGARGRLLVASVFLLTCCSRVATFRPTQLPALQALATEREVTVQDDEGGELTITRSTRLTLHVPGFPPIESRPERMGFAPTSLRLGTAFEPQAPVLEYARIQRVDARVRNATGTYLAIFIPIGVFLTLVLICAADDSCAAD